MEQSNLTKQAAICIAVYLLLLLLTIFLPIIEIITLFFLPLPFILFSARFGWKPGAVTALIAVFAALFITFVSIPFSLVACLGGVMIGSAMHQQLTPYETWARGTVGYLLGIVGSFLFIQAIFDIDILGQFRSAVQSSVQSSSEMMNSLGIDFGEEERAAVTEQMEILIDLLPVLFVAAALVLGFITQWLGYKLVNKMDKKDWKFPPFRTFRLPVAVIWIYFAAILLTIISGEESSSIYLAAVNVTNLAGLLAALQGFSFVLFYTHKKKLSRAMPVITILIIVFFPLIGLYLMRILGIIDLGFSLRDRIKDKD